MFVIENDLFTEHTSDKKEKNWAPTMIYPPISAKQTSAAQIYKFREDQIYNKYINLKRMIHHGIKPQKSAPHFRAET